ncbi:MAG: gluconate 2-dehydrogenase subunit 3 family protein [Rhodothermales bacterium]
MNRREALTRVGYLMGGVLAAPTVAGVLGGCRTGTDAAGGWAALSTDQAGLVAAVTNTIVPETDTPGAGDAGVPGFIDRMLAEWYPERLRERFLTGLDALEREALEATGSSFVDLSNQQQRDLLVGAAPDLFGNANRLSGDGASEPAEGGSGETADGDATEMPETVRGSTLSEDLKLRVTSSIQGAARRVAARRPDGGPVVRADVAHEGDLTGDPSFFHMLKELTLVGYYTSEAGATQELRFVQVPGRWEACIPFSDVGRTWAI